MRKFTTDYARLLAFLEEDIRNGREEYALETAETLLRFHRDKDIPARLLAAAAVLASERRQFLLAARLYEKLAGPPDSPASRAAPEEAEAALKLGMIYSRFLLQSHLAMPYLEKAAESDTPHRDLAREEMKRIEGLFAFRCPPHNPWSEEQMVALAAFADLPVSPVCDRVAEALGAPKAEITPRFEAHSGIIFRGLSDGDAASAAVDILQDMGLPAFHFAASYLDKFKPALKRARFVKPGEDKLELGVSAIGAPTAMDWDELYVFAAAKVKYAEQKDVKKGVLPRISERALGGYSVTPPPTERRTEEKHREYIVFITKEPFVAWLFDADKGNILRPYVYSTTGDSPPKGKEEWLAEIVIRRAEHAFISYGAHLLAYDGFGGDWKIQTFRSEQAFGDLLRWFMAMREFGLV